MTAVCQPHPSVSQKMDTRKAGIAMIKNARFIFAAFLAGRLGSTLCALLTPLRRAGLPSTADTSPR
jgi:hypothetical protein